MKHPLEWWEGWHVGWNAHLEAVEKMGAPPSLGLTHRQLEEEFQRGVQAGKLETVEVALEAEFDRGYRDGLLQLNDLTFGGEIVDAYRRGVVAGRYLEKESALKKMGDAKDVGFQAGFKEGLKEAARRVAGK